MNPLAAGIFSGITLATVLIWLVVASGHGFGAQCDRIFPNDPLRAANCVINLSHGDRP